MTYRSGLWTAYSLFDYISNLFKLTGSIFTLPLTYTKSKVNPSKVELKNKRNAWPILRGLLLAIPVLLIFSALFASADLIFAEKLNGFFSLFNLENLSEYIFRGIYILVISYFIVGLIRHAATRSQDEKLIGLDKPAIAPFLGFTEAAVILGSVVLLFSIFVVIQFQYFFSGQVNISLTGFTYSEYARRGFGELVAVAVFSLLLFQSLATITKFETREQHKRLSGLLIGLVGLVLVILVSAFQRLSLYEAAYGFSRLRTYSHIFMIWLGIILIAMVIIQILNHQRAFANVVLLAMIGFAITLNLLNVDGFIARRNIKQSLQGTGLDTNYLTSLSSDAVPALAKEYSATLTHASLHQGIGAVLVCQNTLKIINSLQPKTWESFNFSDWIAARNLQAIQPDLKNYQVLDDSWPIMIIASDGTEYPCQDYFGMD